MHVPGEQETTATDWTSEQLGRNMIELVSELYPFHRSVTGAGNRNTLRRIAEHIPLNIHEIGTGTTVFDWRVPKEWVIRDAYIKDAQGKRVVDYKESNLHVVGYSTPVSRNMTWEELKPKLHTLPEYPEWIPYKTAPFEEGWGFCLTHNDFLALERMGNRTYEVYINSELFDGALTYGEAFLPGAVRDEVLISTHICHPSLANDNLSGIVVASFLAKYLGERNRRYSYRFVFAPSTIGAIAWLSRNESKLEHIKHGLVLALLGDSGPFTFKKTRLGDAEIDRVVLHVLENNSYDGSSREFEPIGYDERQYCSPGINLPVGCLMRAPYSGFPEYHTSADNLEFVKAESLAESLKFCIDITSVLEENRIYTNTSPKGEPQLGKRGLYRAFNHDGEQEFAAFQRAVQWVLNLSDGTRGLLDVANRAGISFALVKHAADCLVQNDLLAERSPPK